MQKGFSLIELLVVISIILVLTLCAIPSFKTYLSHSKEQVLLSQLIRSIQLARSEAITRNAAVTLCHSNNSIDCTGEWKNGAILMEEQKNISTIQFVATQGKLNWRAARKLEYLVFQSDGMLQPENGTFWYCSLYAENPTWAVMIGHVGKPRILYPDSEGNILDGKGERITC
jgi:type IV fimbrial biogenesis protein FimT